MTDRVREQPPTSTPHQGSCSFTYTATDTPDPIFPPTPEVTVRTVARLAFWTLAGFVLVVILSAGVA